MTAIRNLEAKAASLKKLVAEAAEQARKPRNLRNPWGPEFDEFEKNDALEGLADVLQSTDAILVLDELLKGDGA